MVEVCLGFLIDTMFCLAKLISIFIILVLVNDFVVVDGADHTADHCRNIDILIYILPLYLQNVVLWM